MAGTNAPAGTPDQTLKGCLSFVVALLVVGTVAEAVYRISPTASYLLVAAVILGYLLTGNHRDELDRFLTDIIAGSK